MGVLTTSDILRMVSPCTRILIVEDDETMGQALFTVLNRDGYEATLATTGSEGLRKIREGDQFDLLLLDVLLPDLDGWEILSRIRVAPATARIPVIMLTAMTDENAEIELLAAGADDYIAKPFSFDNLMAHIKALCRRSALQSINPLTGLPGNRQVERFLERCAKEHRRFWAAAYIDINNFKAYNDCYGFLQGDEVLKMTAEIIGSAAKSYPHDVFVGHIGGDDFFAGFISDADRGDPAAVEMVRREMEVVVARFEKTIKKFYNKPDLARGYLEAESRRGGVERYLLMTISIAVATNTRRIFNHPLEISNTLASVKRKAKSQPGSAIYFDQRRR